MPAPPVPETAPAVPALPVPEAAPAVSSKGDLRASCVGDSIADGTALTVGQEFTQTWYMKNVGSSAWPTGITVKFCGGDCMFLKSAEHSLNATLTDSEIAPAVTVGLSVVLSATCRPTGPTSRTGAWLRPTEGGLTTVYGATSTSRRPQPHP